MSLEGCLVRLVVQYDDISFCVFLFLKYAEVDVIVVHERNQGLLKGHIPLGEEEDLNCCKILLISLILLIRHVGVSKNAK